MRLSTPTAIASPTLVTARPVIAAVYGGRRNYVEIVAGARGIGTERTSPVGLGIIDAEPGRILVRPERADDGEWISHFAPGTSEDKVMEVALEAGAEDVVTGEDGSIELVETRNGTSVSVQLPSMPHYHEQMIIDSLTKKLVEEYGAPAVDKSKKDKSKDKGDKDKDGKVLSVIELSGSIPLSELGLSIDQAATLIASQPQPETTNGPDHRE